jgi:hypothetical protein
LAKFADAAIHTPGLELAPFARDAGISDEASIRRLQARWRTERERLLGEAQTRFDARPPESLGQILADLLAGLSRIAELTSKPVMSLLRASTERAERRWDARNRLGKPSPLPFDPGEPGELEPALARFENAVHPPGSAEVAELLGDRTLAELPLSLRLYVLAVLLHEMSLDQRRREAEQADAQKSGEPADKERRQ